jgi:cytidine deaminase
VADQSVVSVVALEVTDGEEAEFLSLTGQLQAMVRNKGYGTNQLLQDGSHPRRFYDIRIWRNADAAAKAEADSDITGLRRDLAKHLHSTPLVDVAWAVEMGLAAAGPWQERRRLDDRRAAGDRRVQNLAFSGPEKRVGTDRRIGPRRMGAPLTLTFGDGQRRSLEGPASSVTRLASIADRQPYVVGDHGAQSSIVQAARAARERALAAFSEFKVGAALETTDGRIISGCNIENSTYGLTMCAERVAIFKAISEGHRSFARIAVVADTPQPTSPCGACRQMLWEFAGNIEVILADLDNVKTTHQLKDLLPHPFDARFIE